MPEQLQIEREPSPSNVTSGSSPHHALAQRLLSAEGQQAGSAAAGRVFAKLSKRLDQLITPVGSEALLGRAVHLSRTAFPFFADLEHLTGTGALIDSLRDAAANVEPGQAREGLVSLLGTLISLLESFIGKSLTFRLLRDVWPELHLEPPESAPDAQ